MRVHLKLDTGMGRYGFAELPAPTRDVVGLMSHLATADTDPGVRARQLERFDEIVAPVPRQARCHIANSAAALRLPEARFDAARCGVALYGLSPFGDDPAADGLEPVLRWRSQLAQVKLLAAGGEHGLRAPLRRRAADVDRPRAGRLRGRLPPRPHGHARCSSTASRARSSARSRWTRSPSSCRASCPAGTPVTLIGDGVLAESHAAVAGTIDYEIVSGIDSDPARAPQVVDA